MTPQKIYIDVKLFFKKGFPTQVIAFREDSNSKFYARPRHFRGRRHPFFYNTPEVL